jgi:hypothetical protein
MSRALEPQIETGLQAHGAGRRKVTLAGEFPEEALGSIEPAQGLIRPEGLEFIRPTKPGYDFRDQAIGCRNPKAGASDQRDASTYSARVLMNGPAAFSTSR